MLHTNFLFLTSKSVTTIKTAALCSANTLIFKQTTQTKKTQKLLILSIRHKKMLHFVIKSFILTMKDENMVSFTYFL